MSRAFAMSHGADADELNVSGGSDITANLFPNVYEVIDGAPDVVAATDEFEFAFAVELNLAFLRVEAALGVRYEWRETFEATNRTTAWTTRRRMGVLVFHSSYFAVQ